VSSTLSGWGRIPALGSEILSTDLEAVTAHAALSRGLGRSYGDASLPARPSDKVVATRLADRVLAFDDHTGVMRVEAGLSLAELVRVWMPRGWFVPVTPGTKFVTVGGMVASDVHGKNHHRDGCFGAHVRALRVRLASGDVVSCSADVNADLFYGTIGGMGLLGHILEVELVMHRIPSAWIHMESERVANIDEFLAALERAAGAWPMTMGWIDCASRGSALGRGILMAGRWADAIEARGVPHEPKPHELKLDLPSGTLNGFTTAAFNALYYWSHFEHREERIVAPDPFFYPLDRILAWNRAYGRRGFTQYQCVLPRAAGASAVRALLERTSALGCASPLCVIKDCGPEGRGALSFPLEGTSVAIDVAVTDRIQEVIDALNEIVIAAGGRVYLTKDRFTRAEHFAAMEPRLDAFRALRDKWDPRRELRSALSVRLLGDIA